ncbi:hypothetical protein SAMN05421638_1151 [Kaistella treverensis]|uniref:DUF2946 domain-containing protein n=1 Tax=Kaistella treverensis TaxID=631455 RepID=A0A1I3LIE2_9FLAO|nr:DUF6660 family protein [Kaistella treverensis]SFI84512.1 hypothetical protein SAMN05421638_1151 [Kaistella treverensis]
MKIFAFLLSLFFMALTVVPCSDAASGFGDKVCVAEDVHLEQSQDEHTDLCTPFCVCNCCGMTLSVSQINTLLPEHHKVVIKDILPDRKYHHKILHPAGIWQPPKIG